MNFLAGLIYKLLRNIMLILGLLQIKNFDEKFDLQQSHIVMQEMWEGRMEEVLKSCN
jgi:hypothetical protein